MRENDVPYREMMGGLAGQMETRVLPVPKFPGLTGAGCCIVQRNPKEAGNWTGRDEHTTVFGEVHVMFLSLLHIICIVISGQAVC